MPRETRSSELSSWKERCCRLHKGPNSTTSICRGHVGHGQQVVQHLNMSRYCNSNTAFIKECDKRTNSEEHLLWAFDFLWTCCATFAVDFRFVVDLLELVQLFKETFKSILIYNCCWTIAYVLSVVLFVSRHWTMMMMIIVQHNKSKGVEFGPKYAYSIGHW